MSATTSSLETLHQLLIQLDAKRHELKSGPEQIQGRKNVVEKKLAEIAAHKLSLIGMQKSADQKNLQFKSNEQKIVDQKGKLGLCKNNNEYQILNGQITSETKANTKLEEEYLALTEQIDAAKKQMALLNEQLATAQAEVKTVEATVSTSHAGLNVAIADLTAKSDAAKSCIPEELRLLFNRLEKGYGARAISVVEGHACTECYTDLTSQRRVELKMGKILVCSECGRFQYLRKP